MKLELKHIVGYLPYKIEVQYTDCLTTRKRRAYITNAGIEDIETTYKRKINSCSGDIISWIEHNNVHDIKVKLFLRPLSDIGQIQFMGLWTKETDFESILKFIESDSETRLSFKFSLIFWESLYEWHFDIHGLIEAGLAININNLEP